MCIVTGRDVTETILVIIIIPTSMSETIQERRESLQMLWVLVWCLLYFVTYGFTQKEQTYTHKGIVL